LRGRGIDFFRAAQVPAVGKEKHDYPERVAAEPIPVAFIGFTCVPVFSHFTRPPNPEPSLITQLYDGNALAAFIVLTRTERTY
jgi:hypothetical protein